MEGTPVREPERLRSAIGLHYAENRQALERELVRLSKEELRDVDVFVVLADAETGELHFPSNMESQIHNHPGLLKKLEFGELVGLTQGRSSVVMIPIVYQRELQGTIGVVTPLDGPQLSHESLEGVRQLTYLAAPLFARLSELERIHQRNRDLNVVFQMRAHMQSNIAHELRTPLAAIRGYARMLIDGRAGEMNGTQRDYLTIIAENTNKLVHLIEWMTRVSERTTKHLKLNLFDLRDVWSESLKSQAEQLRGIRVEHQIPGEPFVVVADRDRLGGVFKSMVSVAANALTRGGNMRIEFSRGREREVVVKLFCAAEIPGLTGPTSSALSEVHDVVGMHGGRLFVTGKAGDGTTLIITLPAVTTDSDGEREK